MELLLIVITVAIGTLVYSFASAAFGGFGTGFSNLVQNAGQQLSENLVVEQTYFFNSNSNNTICAFFNPGPSYCGGVMYVRNVGANSITIDSIYMVNESASPNTEVQTVATGPIPSPTSPSSSCSSNGNYFSGLPWVCFFTFANVGPPANLCGPIAADPYCNNLLPLTVAPGAVVVIHFMLPDPTSLPSSSGTCNASNPPTTEVDCETAFGGTTYAFTLVTARGNDFVAYERV